MSGIKTVKLFDDTVLKNVLTDVHAQLKEDSAHMIRLEQELDETDKRLQKEIKDTAERTKKVITEETDAKFETMRKKNEKKFKEIDALFVKRKEEFDTFKDETETNHKELTEKHEYLEDGHKQLKLEYEHNKEEVGDHFEKSDAVLYRLKELVDPMGAEYVSDDEELEPLEEKAYE
jgi:hypothetical protein